MLITIRLAILALILTLLAVQCSHSDQLDNIEEKVDKIYDSQCLYCSRIGIVDVQDL
jgi:hypothetical protein